MSKLRLAILGSIIFALVVCAVYVARLDPKIKAPKTPEAKGELWGRIKARLFDQDLPPAPEKKKDSADMNEISAPSSAPGLNPTQVLEGEKQQSETP